MIVFAGPNGSGKSTINQRILQDPQFGFQGEYINADDIARSLAGRSADALALSIEAAGLAARRRTAAMDQRRPFAFETVMSTPEKVAIMTRARACGYQVILVFVSTSDPELNIARVANRVACGGHDVDPGAVRRRYHRAMALLPCALEHADCALVLDNSGGQPLDLVLKADGQLHTLCARPPQWLADMLGPYAQRVRSRAHMEREMDRAFAAQCARGAASAPPSMVLADASEGAHYRGKIVAATGQHALQQTGASHFVLHDRMLSASAARQTDQPESIAYAYDKGRIAAPG